MFNNSPDSLPEFYTWGHLSYVAVLKSGHTTATIGISIHTFSHGSKLPTAAVLWSVATTAKVK